MKRNMLCLAIAILIIISVYADAAIDRNVIVTTARSRIGDHYKYGMHFGPDCANVWHPYTYGAVSSLNGGAACGAYSSDRYPTECLHCKDLPGQGQVIKDMHSYRRDCVSWAMSDCRSHGHFDCSGFVWWVFNQVDPSFFAGSIICASQRSVTQLKAFAQGKGWFHTVSSKSDWDNMKPGDWIFFNNCSTDTAQHIGIYTGPNTEYNTDDLRRYKIVLCDGGPACELSSDDGLYVSALDGKQPGVHEPIDGLATPRYHCQDDPENVFKYIYPAAYAQVAPPQVPTTITCNAPICSCDGNPLITATLTRNDTGAGVSGKSVCFYIDGSATPNCNTTDANGVAEFDLGTFRSLKPGSHTFCAKFDGDDDLVASQSSGCSFTAPAETKLSCSVSPAEIECTQDITISATLQKETDTNSYSAFSGQSVKFTVTKSGGSPANPITKTAITDNDGKAQVTVKPESAGNYNIKAEYAGDSGACICSSEASAAFKVWATVTVSKFNDCNMNGEKDSDETILKGWPLRLYKVVSGSAPVEMTDKDLIDVGNYIKFKHLEEGQYKVVESDSSLTWQRYNINCNSSSYCELRTTWDNKRWLFVAATVDGVLQPFDMCSGDVTPSVGPFTLACKADVAFGNVQLGTVTAFKYHDLNMNGNYEPSGEAFTDTDTDGEWTPGEAFTDLDCDGVWDKGEFFYDSNKNDVYNAAESFVDSDGDKTYDYPECPIQDWPFALDGLRADDEPICLRGLTAADGTITFVDVPPAKSTYSLSENSSLWTDVNLPAGVVKRTTQPARVPCACGSLSTIDRWEATTPIEAQFPFTCGAIYSTSFGNVCLSSVNGVKEVYTQGMPGQAAKDADASGWNICLAGKDVRGRDVVPTLSLGALGMPTVLVNQAANAPIAVPCLNPVWYQITTSKDGSFHFLDLPPGHYHLTEQPDHPGYRLSANKPIMCGFDVRCCPEDFVLRNIKDGTSTDVWQVYPGNSIDNEQIFGGYAGPLGDPITAVPGILSIVPGIGWKNFVRSSDLGREAIIRNVTLRKSYDGSEACPDIIREASLVQQGSSRVGLWWPLMYEPPTTSWTLSIYYDTAMPVQFPGETAAAIRHNDNWIWTVVSDIPHMKLFLDMIHELPWGSNQVPLISSEELWVKLKYDLDRIDQDIQNKQLVEAGMKLDTFILDVEDACITVAPITSPSKGLGTGITNTCDNPACCKLILDADYVGQKLGLWAK